jgi:hypothetical protein
MYDSRPEDAYEVWISREEMVDFLLYAANLEASVATRSKMSKNASVQAHRDATDLLTIDE